MQQSILDLIEWSYVICALLFVFYISAVRQQNRSLVYTSSIVVGLNLAMLIMEQSLKEVVDRDLNRFLWYNSFALCDAIVIAAIHIAHRVNNLVFSRFSQIIQINFLILGLLQIVTYWDQITFNTSFIDATYRLAVPTISFSISLTLIFAVLKDFCAQVLSSLKPQGN